MADIISLRAYARHRGCTLRAVQKAIESKRIPESAIARQPDGRLAGVDPVAADIAWAANTDPSEAAKSGKVIAPAARQADLRAAPSHEDARPGELQLEASTHTLPREATANRDAPGSAGSIGSGESASSPVPSPTLVDYRTERERYLAEEAKLDHLERLGALVPAADVERAQMSVARQVRDAVMAVPDRVCGLLAAETDPARIRAVLTSELRGTLKGLAQHLEA